MYLLIMDADRESAEERLSHTALGLCHDPSVLGACLHTCTKVSVGELMPDQCESTTVVAEAKSGTAIAPCKRRRCSLRIGHRKYRRANVLPQSLGQPLRLNAHHSAPAAVGYILLQYGAPVNTAQAVLDTSGTGLLRCVGSHVVQRICFNP